MRLNGIIGLVSGLVIGATTGWFVTKKLYEKKMAEHDTESRKMFHQMCKDVREGKITPAEIPVQERQKTDSKQGTDASELERPVKDSGKRVVENKKSYNRLLSEHNRELTTSAPDLSKYDPPFEIAEAEVGVMGHFDEVRLIWFLDDCILCDPRDGFIYDELDDILGSGICDILSDEERLPPILYIRNCFLKFDIILKIEKEAKYAETFLSND